MRSRKDEGAEAKRELTPIGELLRQSSDFRPPTRAQQKLIDAAVQIQEEAPTAEDLAFMTRELVQCTLPHRDPGTARVWSRSNGNLTLTIQPGVDPQTLDLLGYPYGSIPRLILFWVTTEALRTGSKRLELGYSYSSFLREIGFSPETGRGKRGDAKRVMEQTRRLFAANVSFIQTAEIAGLQGERRRNMVIADESELWWSPKLPTQTALFPSWVELGEKFFNAITASPVPVDVRALRALKRSPLALDLYAWSTYKALSAARKGKPHFIPWRALAQQFGADYTNVHDFKKQANIAFKKIQEQYRGLKLKPEEGGIVILPTSKPAIPAKACGKL
ncbi:MAG: plasmid encoded RepA protein [Bryobacterales bacterium]|nr:plasmid encoded RepA protein [Bryobacterales bacterium]